jgi:malate/lactate dehydrogenase
MSVSPALSSFFFSSRVILIAEQGEAIEQFASRNVKVLVIANPANTNCLIVSETAPSIPKYNFTCLTRLDHDRLIGMVVNKLNSLPARAGTVTNPSHVRDVIVFGNHSTTQVPYVDKATVSTDGTHWHTVRSLIESEWVDGVLPGLIQNRGAEIIHHLEASSAMSAARAIIRHLHDWIGPVSASVHRTGEHGEVESPIFSMGVWSPAGNSYDVPEGIVFSFPCRRVVGSHLHRHDTHSHSHHRNEVHPHQDYEIVSGLPLTDQQKIAIGLSVDELLMEKSMAKHNFVDTLTGKLEQELNI